MNDKDHIELVRIAGRLSAVEQDVAQLKTDVAVVKQDVTEMKTDLADIKKDMAYMKGQINVIVELLSSVVSLIKIPDD